MTKTGLPLLMRSEDDRRLNRTKNTLARTEPCRATRGKRTSSLIFFFRKKSLVVVVRKPLLFAFSHMSFRRYNALARSTDTLAYLWYSHTKILLQNDDGEHVRRGEVARGQSQGVHVPQVHALARAASHLAAADVLAVVVLRIAYWTYFFKPLGVSSVNKKHRLVFSRFKGDASVASDDEKKGDKNRKARSFSRV